jgi:hypothetical protein
MVALYMMKTIHNTQDKMLICHKYSEETLHQFNTLLGSSLHREWHTHLMDAITLAKAAIDCMLMMRQLLPFFFGTTPMGDTKANSFKPRSWMAPEWMSWSISSSMNAVWRSSRQWLWRTQSQGTLWRGRGTPLSIQHSTENGALILHHSLRQELKPGLSLGKSLQLHSPIPWGRDRGVNMWCGVAIGSTRQHL